MMKLRNKSARIAQFKKCIKKYIFDDESLRNVSDMDSIINRIERMFNNPAYLRELRASNKNWLDISADEAMEKVLSFLKELAL